MKKCRGKKGKPHEKRKDTEKIDKRGIIERECSDQLQVALDSNDSKSTVHTLWSAYVHTVWQCITQLFISEISIE